MRMHITEAIVVLVALLTYGKGFIVILTHPEAGVVGLVVLWAIGGLFGSLLASLYVSLPLTALLFAVEKMGSWVWRLQTGDLHTKERYPQMLSKSGW